MEDELSARVASFHNTRIVCRTGDPANLHDLRIANASEARSIVVLGAGRGRGRRRRRRGEGRARRAAHRREPRGPDRRRGRRRGRRRRALREAGGDRVLTVRSSDVIANITAQACRQSGLAAVCQELLDFDGDEIYFQSVPALVGHTFGEALLGFEASTIIGIRRPDGAVALNPPMDAVIARRRLADRGLRGRRHRRLHRVPGRDRLRGGSPAGRARRPPSSSSSSGGTRSGPRCCASSTSSRTPARAST